MATPAIDSLDGPALRDLFAAGAGWLERHVDQVNAINVFPVPDGDTGTNMYLTVRSTLEEAQRCAEPGVGAMLSAMSHGALMGARGNSGVILSQIIRGMARVAEGSRALDGAALAQALEEGSSAAYRAVTKPVEGTILTVVRDVAQAAQQKAASDSPGIPTILEAAVEAGRESVARTPTLLPVLAEAGVVDAGGQGLYILLEGMLRAVRGEPLDMPLAAGTERVGQEWLNITEQLHSTAESLYGYCTEVLIAGRDLDADAIRSRISQLGDSVLVVGDERLVRVHVHTDDPGAALSHGTSLGSLLQVKVDNIRRQAERFVEMHEEQQPSLELPSVEPEAISSVAVAAGEGLASVFRSFGCTKVVSGGPTMNPSTRDIVEAIDACPTEDVVVLPNDKNIIMAAQQAVELTSKRLRVVPTRSIPQGIAALLVLNQDSDLETNAQAMDEARQGVRTVEVTRAVRSTVLKGVKVREGQIIAIVDDELKLAAQSAEEAAMQSLEELTGDGTSLIALYYGADTTEAQAQALAEELRQRYAGHEVEVVFGGQPHYNYIISVE